MHFRLWKGRDPGWPGASSWSDTDYRKQPAGVLPVPAIRKEEILAASRAQRRDFDLLFGHTGSHQLPAVGFRKIQVRLRPLGSSFTYRSVSQRGDHFFADFI